MIIQDSALVDPSCGKTTIYDEEQAEAAASFAEAGLAPDDVTESAGKVSEWIAQGIHYEIYREWVSVGGFDAAAVCQLIEAFVDPDDAMLPSETGYSLAYAFCNGDITLVELQEAIKNAVG
jgi:hypothetical protein